MDVQYCDSVGEGTKSVGRSEGQRRDVNEGRCVIVETNYRVYAYTTSVLQVPAHTLLLSFPGSDMEAA
eukprot:2071305-Rhodomonas_salina.1